MDLENLKSIFNELKEAEFSFTPLPSFTCPDINAIIKSILTVIKLCKKQENSDFADEVQRELCDVEEQMECIRGANSTLRDNCYEYKLKAVNILAHKNEVIKFTQLLLTNLEELKFEKEYYEKHYYQTLEIANKNIQNGNTKNNTTKLTIPQ